MKIFVTGGAGFIGSNFIRHVLSLRKAYSVVNYDKLTYAGNLGNLDSVANDSRYRFVRATSAIPPPPNPRCAIAMPSVHFAAESHVDRSIYDPAPAIETNVKGTFVLLQVAKQARYRPLRSHFYRRSVRRHGTGHLFKRDPHAQPEQPVLRFEGSFRSSGPFLRAHVWISGFDHALVEQLRPIPVSGKIPPADDHQRSRQQTPADLWRRQTTARLAARGRQLPRNSRSSRARTDRRGLQSSAASTIEENLTMAQRLLRAMGKPETLLTYVKDRPGHDRRYALDCKKIETEIGWKPAIALDEGLRQTIAWYEANSEWLAGVRGGEYQSYYEKYYENRNPSLNAIPHERRRTLQN